VRQYELGAGRGARLDACLGLAQAQGKPPWWLREARGTRDDLLRLVAARFSWASRRAPRPPASQGSCLATRKPGGGAIGHGGRHPHCTAARSSIICSGC
jgi:hypothetical protein